MGVFHEFKYTKRNYHDISRTHWVANSTGYNLCWITCHKQSLFSSVSKNQYTSHELTWYWHIHVALCHPIVQHMLFNIVSSDVYFDFPKFEENKDFSKFSYNYVHLAHAILYVATIVMTGCSVHSEVLHFYHSRWLYLNTDIYFVGPLGILSLCTGCIWHVLSYQAQAWSRTRIQSNCQ